MPDFVIERDMPGVGGLSAEQRKQGARASVDALRDLGPEIQWATRSTNDFNPAVFCDAQQAGE